MPTPFYTSTLVGNARGYAPDIVRRLSWYTFRISLFIYLGLNCDLSIESMKALGGWSSKSEMPAHYQAKGRFYQGLNASIAASDITSKPTKMLDVDALLDNKWRQLMLLDVNK